MGRPAFVNDFLQERLLPCVLAITETLRIVVYSKPGIGRPSLTLVPDYHVCVARAHRIIGLVPDAVAQLEPT